MKIELTKEQYRDLIMMNHLANNMLGFLGDHLDEKGYKETSNRTEEFEDYLLEFAKDFSCEDLTEEWKNKMIMDEKVREKMSEITDDYDDCVVHFDLANKLAWRDFRNKYSEKEREEMAKENGGYFGVELHDFEKKYWDEFKEYEYDRLEIVEDREVSVNFKKKRS